MSGGEAPASKRRAIRSYVLRAGRMTEGQASALERMWPRYGIDVGHEPIEPAKVFGRTAPCCFEIGFGNGDNLAALAASHPERDYIGAEVHTPGVGHLLRMAEAQGCINLRVIQQDAVEVLRERIAPGSLDAIVVLFPDPWHKKRHHKRRLVNAEFAALASSRLVVGGTLQLATDWTPYAEQMLEVLNAAPGLQNRSPAGGYVPRIAGRVRTRFEASGERLGHAVHDLCFERVSPSGCSGGG